MSRKWIHDRLEAVGKTQADLAAAMGVAAPRVSEIIAGRREIKITEIPAMARTLSMDAGVLALKIAGNDSARVVPLRGLEVRAAVQAGYWQETVEWPPDQWYVEPMPIEDRRYPGMELHAVEVRGNSMNKLYPEGTVLAFINLIENPVSVAPGATVVVERHNRRGEVEYTVKELQIDEDGRFWLWPRSSDPEHQTPIRADDGAQSETDVRVVGLVVRASKPV